MPELPEVQTITNELNKILISQKIAKIASTVPKMLQGDVKLANHQKIISVKRIAKNIIIGLANKSYLVFHLKMTGQLFWLAPHQKQTSFGESVSKHTHIIIDFQNRAKLLFNDIRKFGWLQIVSQAQLDQYLHKQHYGPDPLTSDFNLAYLQTIQQSRPKAKIKQILLDQKMIAGIGNIYADEALFVAKIKPDRVMKSLTKVELSKLIKAIGEVLKLALKYKGTSIESYRRVTGERGTYDQHRLVYRRKGELCPNCSGKIERIKIGGRSSHFCSACQK